jgi:hypothetical protein
MLATSHASGLGWRRCRHCCTWRWLRVCLCAVVAAAEVMAARICAAQVRGGRCVCKRARKENACDCVRV